MKIGFSEWKKDPSSQLVLCSVLSLYSLLATYFVARCPSSSLIDYVLSSGFHRVRDLGPRMDVRIRVCLSVRTYVLVSALV